MLRSAVTDAENHVTMTRYDPDGQVWKGIDAKDNDSADSLRSATRPGDRELLPDECDVTGMRLKMEEAADPRGSLLPYVRPECPVTR